ncbi:SOS response-associated peptidase [Candidatus Contubernalis alkaliaceticus]|uniref:SOS response-associated peptidase n=1 Tax=Candidatus Contubernalis alkaliaceticus TaxID=338645 RepID=UPI001F4BD511|nr:SOS response-associated peptidase [Candidatus Contubernalis alkalaceticus]UNC90997.1 SOS response-associated peptidase [Candidatus Contubernalis alkalaceticus]
MCGRYKQGAALHALMKRYLISKELQKEYTPLNEVFPSQVVPAVVEQGERELQLFKWGFTVGFKKGLVINARGETVDTKPLFKQAFLKGRCLIPAEGFFEWKKDGQSSEKHFITLADGSIFSMAGIYNRFKDSSGIEYEAFVIITTASNNQVVNIHNRMPVILSRQEEELWLNPELEDVGLLKSLLKPYEGEEIELKVLKC